MFNITQAKYSIIHNRAIKLLAEKYGLSKISYFSEQIDSHDMDKVVGYLQDSVLTTHKNHVLHSPHHIESQLGQEDNAIYETILDWDSSRYTKPDKQLNAYQTLKKIYPRCVNKILPLLKRMGIDTDNDSLDENILEQLGTINLSNNDVLDIVVDAINKMRQDDRFSYLDFDKLLLSVYQSLTKEEQGYLKGKISEDQLQEILKGKKKLRIGLFTHKGNDYDAICSTLVMAEYIKSLTNEEDIEVVPVIEDSPLLRKVNSKVKTYILDEVLGTDFDCAIICDVNEQDRVYGMEVVNSVPLDRRYVIDHHDQNRKEITTLDTNKLVIPAYSSTCEGVAELLMLNNYPLSKEMAQDLYRGMASDTFGFERNVTIHTEKVAGSLPLTDESKKSVIDDLTRMSTLQEELYDKITVYPCDENIKIYTLLESAEAGDITKLLKHKKFDELTGPTEDDPVTCFIIGIGNNYFLKLKKNFDCDIDLLSVAIGCNGGGHETRCAGRFFNTDFDTVLKKLLEEYKKSIGVSKTLTHKKRII